MPWRQGLSMRVLLKQAALIVVPEDDAERDALTAFGGRNAGRVFHCGHDGEGLQLFDIGPEDVVRNKPINITSRTPARST
jgi:hypothetical protein